MKVLKRAERADRRSSAWEGSSGSGGDREEGSFCGWSVRLGEEDWLSGLSCFGGGTVETCRKECTLHWRYIIDLGSYNRNRGRGRSCCRKVRRAAAGELDEPN